MKRATRFRCDRVDGVPSVCDAFKTLESIFDVRRDLLWRDGGAVSEVVLECELFLRSVDLTKVIVAPCLGVGSTVKSTGQSKKENRQRGKANRKPLARESSEEQGRNQSSKRQCSESLHPQKSGVLVGRNSIWQGMLQCECRCGSDYGNSGHGESRDVQCLLDRSLLHFFRGLT